MIAHLASADGHRSGILPAKRLLDLPATRVAASDDQLQMLPANLANRGNRIVLWGG
jgi:hypothetical protein